MRYADWKKVRGLVKNPKLVTELIGGTVLLAILMRLILREVWSHQNKV